MKRLGELIPKLRGYYKPTVFVPHTSAHYAELYEKTKTGDAREWRWDEKRAGIWVASRWITWGGPG